MSVNYFNSHKGNNNQHDVLKINKGGFMLHSVVSEEFSEGLMFKPRPGQ